MQRWWRGAVLVGVAVVVALPALRQPPTDGFPLSTYPMFASDRGRTSVVATAVGRTSPDAEDGRPGPRRRLSPELIAGTDEPMLAVATAARAVRDGDEDTWCREIARRVAADGSGDIARIEVVVETHDAVAHFAADAPPQHVEVRASCEVPR